MGIRSLMPAPPKMRAPRAEGPAAPANRAARLLWPLTLVNTFGNGLFRVNSALFFTHVGDMTAAQFGTGLAAGGVFGVLASVPFGRAADRWGARRVLMVLWAAEAVGLLGYTQVHSFWLFLVLICPITALDRGSVVAYRALLATALPQEGVVEARAKLRALANVGVGLGAGVGGLALAVNTSTAYFAVIVVDCLTFVVAAAMLARLPIDVAAAPVATGQDRRRTGVLRDRRYVLFSAICTVLALQFGIFEVGLPLWVVRDTDAPREIVAVALVMNTALVALLQVRLSRGSEDNAGAVRVGERAGWLLALGCAVFVASRFGSAIAATVLVLGAALVMTIAEVYFAASSTTLSYNLAPDGQAGAYQGLFQSGTSIATSLAPVVMTSGVLPFPVWGWLALGGVFAVAGTSLRWIDVGTRR
ncbi:MFS transporter [Kitasatospora sp. NPDC048365]|uniref:MFS transporter n=1 Tax=Kitasatospora sp. NPDC048365 TaxID=3364050 RepID=UPI00371D5DEC